MPGARHANHLEQEVESASFGPVWSLLMVASSEKPDQHWIKDGRSEGRIVLAVDDAPTGAVSLKPGQQCV